ncbi:MAG: HAD-IB family phosphatase [Cyanobacteria bacterium P01_G01_bin.39]
MNSSKVVFCDFDGTITTQDTFVSMLEKFVPEVAARVLPAIFSREISLKAAINLTLGSIPTTYYAEIIEFMSGQPIRPGLPEFIDFLNYYQVPLIVISGGLTAMVRAVLERQGLADKVTAIHAGEVDTTGEFLRAYSTVESDTEFIAKAMVMERYPTPEKVAIGDSVTDINMSLAADLVFARDRLMQYLDLEDKPYVMWQDFFEIRDHLATRWQIN